MMHLCQSNVQIRRIQLRGDQNVVELSPEVDRRLLTTPVGKATRPTKRTTVILALIGGRSYQQRRDR